MAIRICVYFKLSVESTGPREGCHLKASVCLEFVTTHLKIRSDVHLVYIGHCLLIYFLHFGKQIFLSHSSTPFSLRDKTLRTNLFQTSFFLDPRYLSNGQ